MLSFIQKGQAQMTTIEANTSRLVTKVRWVVESANARIKSWRYLANVLPTNQVPFIKDCICIVCALANKYLPPLATGKDNDEALAAKMLKLSHRINTLKQRVEDENLGKRTAVWKEPSNNLEDLAKKTCETCGVYQIRMSSSYIHEHLNRNFQFFVHQEDECLIRVKLQSRSVASKVYLLRIEYDASAVTALYCKCKSGARVNGVCAHIASILWYLEYARHNSDIRFGVKN